MVTIELLDVPSSAGAHSPGQEQAPAALRRTGLLKAFAEHGLDVVDQGEQPVTRWQPVREARGVSNASAVVSVAEQTAQRVAAAVTAGHFPLVIGGDCSITVGVLSGLLTAGADPGLVHFDIDVVDFFDLQLADIPVHIDSHTGLPFDLTMDCLDEFLSGPAAGLVLTEINPDHGTDADLTRLATRLAQSLIHLS